MSVKFTSCFWMRFCLLFLLFAVTFSSLQAQSDTASSNPSSSKDSFLRKFEFHQAGKNRPSLLSIAEHNQYPFPQKVLQWQKKLQLNERQEAAISIINKELQRKILEMNNFLIVNENAMDSLFRYKKMSNGNLIYYTNRYGLYQGELRNALLQACLKTKMILTETQIKKYDQLLQD